MGVSLSKGELDAFLLQAPTLILCVNRQGRAPLAVPMWFAWEDERLLINTAARSAKIGHLERDPKVCCLIEAGTEYYQLKAVVLNGVCTIDRHQPRVNSEAWRKRLIANKPIYEALYARQYPPQLARFYQQDRVTLQIDVEHANSWDFAKIKR